MIERYDIMSYDRFDRAYKIESITCNDVHPNESGHWVEWEDVEEEFDWRIAIAREGNLEPLNELLDSIVGVKISTVKFCD